MMTLARGNVLVTGGQNSAGPLASAQLYSASVPLGSPCGVATDCQSGFCADGVCCNTACNAGPCDACSIAAGAAVNGTCALFTGPACNDGSVCTPNDACQAGVCVGAGSILCAARDQCHGAGVCDALTGTCSSPLKQDGTACNDGNACTESDVCQSGVCAGSVAVACTALSSCHVAGVCDAQTGVCTNPPKPDTATCDDGDACTQVDTCLLGACVGGAPLKCPASDECHAAGACDAATGKCSNPSRPDGAVCTGGLCDAGSCALGPNGSSSSGISSSGSSGGSDGSGGAPGADVGGGGRGSGTGASSGCGCAVVGTPALHPAWLGLGLLLSRRRRTLRASSRRGGAME